MKKLIMMLLVSLPLIAIAQVDPKYLEGAIKTTDGRVEFSTEMQVPAMTKEQIYETLLNWAENRFQPSEKFNARVLYKDAEQGSFAIGGEEYLVFSSSALSLDRTRIYYLISVNCENGKCKIGMNRIKYWYNELRDGGEKYNAEEWITDDMALNKNKTKLAPITGKFRRKTIDLKDELFGEIRSALGNQMIALGLKAAPVTPESQVAVVQPSAPQAVVAQPVVTAPQVQPASQPVAEPQATTEEEAMKQAARITLTAGGETLEIDKECWGGKNQLFGKDVTYCIIDTQKAMANMLLAQSETYTISFYQAGNNEPAVVLNCKKMMQQNVKGEEAQKMNPACDASKTYNVYVGEIVK